MDNSGKISRNNTFIGKLENKLPEGAFGITYKATQNGRTVVIKKPLPIHFKIPQLMAKFNREMQYHAQLSHPNIVELLEGNYNPSDASSCYIILEWINQGDLLGFLIRKNVLSNDEIKLILRDIAHGLEYLHNKNYLHRDLKPENVVIQQNQSGLQAKICDFGEIKELHHSEESFRDIHLSGTANYIAFESLTELIYSRKSDVYAFGLIAFFMAAQSIPFDSYENSNDVCKAIRRKEILEIPNSVPEELTLLIKNCYSHDPMQRLFISEALQYKFFRSQEEKDLPLANETLSQERSSKPSMVEISLEAVTEETSKNVYNPLTSKTKLSFFNSRSPSSESEDSTLCCPCLVKPMLLNHPPNG